MPDRNDKINALLKGFSYFVTARYWKGHGVHSPVVYEFISHVLNDKKRYSDYALIENQIKALCEDKRIISYTEYGAGSGIFNSNNRVVSEIARHAGISKKFGRLFYRMAHYYKFPIIIELGTSLGLSTLYFAKGLNSKSILHTVEANESLIKIAREHAIKLNCTNIVFHTGLFDNLLPKLLGEIGEPALVSIDGNHTYEATLNYFNTFSPAITKGFIIVHDIYWSKGMEKAWKAIKKSSEVTIDLYSVGIIVKGDMLTPGHYKIRF